MSPRDLFLQFLADYAAKDIDAIAATLAHDVSLRDWNVSVHGAEAVLRETLKNFRGARSIDIEVLAVYEAAQSVAGELRIVVDQDIELHVVDIIEFDARSKIVAIRSYKGRADADEASPAAP